MTSEFVRALLERITALEAAQPTHKLGVVTAIGPLLVMIGAASTPVAAKRLASYAPTVGDTVSVLVIGADQLVLGTIV